MPKARYAGVEEVLSGRKWAEEAPPFFVQILRLEEQPSRLLIDIETNPGLSAREQDLLLDIVMDYLGVAGRDGGIYSGYLRSDSERRSDYCRYLVVARGQSWEERRAEYADEESE